MNQSDLYHFELWEYDNLQPEERLFVGRKPPRVIPSWATPFPDHLIKNSPPELTDKQKEEREDEYLKQRGIK